MCAWLWVIGLGYALCGTHAAIPTGKSAFLQKVEAGQRPSIFLIGSSLTRSSQSFWSTELQRTLRWLYGQDAIGDVTECSGLGMTMYEMSKEGCITERIGQYTPDAVSLEVGWTDVKDELSIPAMQSTLESLIDDIRQDSPDTEIFLYVPGVPSHSLWEQYQNDLRDAADRIWSVAENKSVRVVWSRDAFLSVYEDLVASNRVSQWDRYVYDTHHPTLRAGVEFIIPAWRAALAGSEDARQVYRPEMPRVVTKYRAQIGVDKDNGHMEVYSGNVALDELEYYISLDGGTSFHAFTPDRFSTSAFYWSMPESIEGQSSYTIKARIKVRSPADDAEFVCEPFETDGLPSQPLPLALQTLVGRHFDIGDSVRFDYVMDDNYVEELDWEISFDGGRNWVAIENEETYRSTRIFHWLATETFKGRQTQTDQCIIRAQDYNDDGYTDNTGLFSLGDPSKVDLDTPGARTVSRAIAAHAPIVSADGILRVPAGQWRHIDVYSIHGRRLMRWSGSGPARLTMPGGEGGVVVHAAPARGASRRFVAFPATR
jgi:hypothetical protein